VVKNTANTYIIIVSISNAHIKDLIESMIMSANKLSSRQKRNTRKTLRIRSILMVFMLFNGFIVSRKDAPAPLHWIFDVSPNAYAMQSIVVVMADNFVPTTFDGMLEKSQKEGDEERVIYAKFKCYCDTNEAEKKASIKELTKQISVLESKIAEIQGDTGGLSTECAELKTKMAENK